MTGRKKEITSPVNEIAIAMAKNAITRKSNGITAS
jgi:hypothetical protein